MSTAAALKIPPGMFGDWDSFPNPTAQPYTPLDFGTLVYSPDDDEWYEREPTGGWTVFILDDVELEVANSPTVAKSEEAAEETYDNSDLDGALSIVREFDRLQIGWDEPDSPIPSAELIEDALVVLQNWPFSDLIPEPSVGTDGNIALELYDNDGFVLGGVEVTGERNAIFSIVRRTEILCTGRFDTTSQTEMIKALSQFKLHL